jgi:amphi-Trp domain-containing protein
MPEAKDFKYSDKMKSEQAAEYLIKLAEGVRNGHLTLQGQGHTITVVPQDVVKLEVHATSKEGKGELELEVSWKEKYVFSAKELEVEAGTTNPDSVQDGSQLPV